MRQQPLTETKVEELFRVQDDLADDPLGWFTDEDLAGLRATPARRVGPPRHRLRRATRDRSFLSC